MKTLIACGLFVFLASGLFAQRRANTVGTNAGYGNVVFPGGRPPITTPFTQTNTTNFATSFGFGASGFGTGFATSLGNVVAGRPAFNGVRRNGNTGAIVYVPYGYPVYGGGGYYGGYGDTGAPMQPTPNITIINAPPPQPMPMMMVGPSGQTQAPGGQVREYGPQEQNAPDASQLQPDYYLLAFKDHSIYSAVGYWVDGDTLHYLTSGNVHNQVSLSLVDRDLTTQLNKGRGVQVNLPQTPSR